MVHAESFRNMSVRTFLLEQLLKSYKTYISDFQSEKIFYLLVFIHKVGKQNKPFQVEVFF